jgi:hypothetical protein
MLVSMPPRLKAPARSEECQLPIQLSYVMFDPKFPDAAPLSRLYPYTLQASWTACGKC